MSMYLLFLVMVVVGFGLGVLYFAALFKTLDRVLRSKEKIKTWMVASFLVRSALLVAVFFFLSAGDWRRIAAMVVGFMIARIFMVRRIRSTSPAAEINESR